MASNAVPVVSKIKVRWLEEVEARQDVVMANGQPTMATRNVPVSSELRLVLGWYTGSVFRGFTEGVWVNQPVEASAPWAARPAAGDLIGDGSVYKQLADALFVLAGTGLVPAGTAGDLAAQDLYQAVTSMEIEVPLHLPGERRGVIKSRDYLDAAKTMPIGNSSFTWYGKAYRANQGITSGQAVEDLFADATIAPLLQAVCSAVGDHMKALLPTLLTFDKDTWLSRLDETVAALTA